MTPERLEFLQNLMAAVGIAVLAVPTFALNFRKKALFRIDAILDRRARTGDAGALDEIAREVREARAAAATTWRLIDENCLFVGYLLVLGSALWRLVG